MGCGRAGARLLPGAVPAGTAPVSTDSCTGPYTWPPFLVAWWGLCGGCRSGPSLGSAVMGYAGRATAGRPWPDPAEDTFVLGPPCVQVHGGQ